MCWITNGAQHKIQVIKRVQEYSRSFFGRESQLAERISFTAVLVFSRSFLHFFKFSWVAKKCKNHFLCFFNGSSISYFSSVDPPSNNNFWMSQHRFWSRSWSGRERFWALPAHARLLSAPHHRQAQDPWGPRALPGHRSEHAGGSVTGVM